MIDKSSLYQKPTDLPGGFLESCQPLADFVRSAVGKAYDEGFAAGRAASTLEHMQALTYKARPHSFS